jgi:hypothetical protein
METRINRRRNLRGSEESPLEGISITWPNLQVALLSYLNFYLMRTIEQDFYVIMATLDSFGLSSFYGLPGFFSGFLVPFQKYSYCSLGSGKVYNDKVLMFLLAKRWMIYVVIKQEVIWIIILISGHLVHI